MATTPNTPKPANLVPVGPQINQKPLKQAPERLKDLDLEQELLEQLRIVQRLQDEVMDDLITPANQRAQCAGQVANALATLAKVQIELYDSERMKKIEACLIEVLQTLPGDAQAQFFKRYEALLGQS